MISTGINPSDTILDYEDNHSYFFIDMTVTNIGLLVHWFLVAGSI